ncbi:formylglycine-generating enzyme family protein [Polymorphobacter sp.]|uniref:formylglycine-generating enzyme family protein n=1 Tax=Polymorphobacter sp. TaxID=1909290 RepID=UPI003F729C60
MRWALLFLAGLLAGPALAAPATFTDCDGCGTMVTIPPGSFKMGFHGTVADRYEGPVRSITFASPFAVAELPVTNAQFARFVAETGHKTPKNCILAMDGTYKAVPDADWQNPGYGRPARDDEPVVCIGWHDAVAYAEWMKAKTGKPYRLMTEAEFEYVARAGGNTLYPWGDDAEGACKVTNILDASANRASGVTGGPLACNDGFPGVAPVGRFPANAYGIKDIVGNAWTWVQDCYAMPYPADMPTDGSAQEKHGCDRRGVRGAAWATTAKWARTTFRGRDPVDRISQLFGVRLARDLP